MDSHPRRPIVQLFTNPGAGRRRADLVQQLEAAFEREGATVLVSLSAGEPLEIAGEATHVCVVGGDGTVRHVACAVMRCRREVRMSIYPAGTINLLAREAAYPRHPATFARLALSNAPHRLHFPVALGEDHFFACAGVSPDSFAVAGVSRGLKRAFGRFAYAVAFLRLLAHWPRHRITLSTGEREIECEAFYVAKGRYYAGGWSFAPEARVHEPLLHVVALRRARRRDYLSFIAALVTHRDVAALGNVEGFTCVELEAKAAHPLPIQADGDIVGALPADMAIRQPPLTFC
jgi:diacylglycerol kinase family enzyme